MIFPSSADGSRALQVARTLLDLFNSLSELVMFCKYTINFVDQLFVLHGHVDIGSDGGGDRAAGFFCRVPPACVAPVRDKRGGHTEKAGEELAGEIRDKGMVGLIWKGLGEEIGYVLIAWYVRYSKLVTIYSILHPVQAHVNAFSHLYFELAVG